MGGMEQEGPLAGRRIAVPETRELEVMARMLERQGASVIRCPLVAILDLEDPAPVEDWLRRFVATPPDDLILLTGEGLSRLLGVARRAGIEPDFRAALPEVRRIVRGPKPTARLRTLGLSPDITAEVPMTEGVIAALQGEALAGHRVGVQLYPDNPNDRLLDFLRSRDAEPDPVTPYRYASREADGQVAALIDAMAAGEVDLIAFTSSPQLRRLREVAKATGREPTLAEALRRTRIAAVGPVVAKAVEEAGGTVAMQPDDNFHLKPMVNEIVAAIG
ncbi:uroporphyrinogen-III synthase [Roseomonas sp. OT10]|uniref:uroporphyrinogen-III synthase n=1 Tax=Roseomonas cutis TaxID=2897332 RepID=UPI001E353F8F|nr:uroporphyrinogen-III synthase [Roseomonas sp. OT10]UFN47167.1 uroporphyrinogen-III synthase [Roseomonas sp. OT10]